MSKNKKEILFERSVAAFQHLTGDSRELCVCPLCGGRFTRQSLNEKVLTLEHVPPKSLDGKEIIISITGEPDITIPLEKKLRSDYPNVNWVLKKTYGIIPVELSDEEMKTADGLVQAICW